MKKVLRLGIYALYLTLTGINRTLYYLYRFDSRNRDSFVLCHKSTQNVITSISNLRENPVIIFVYHYCINIDLPFPALRKLFAKLTINIVVLIIYETNFAKK